MTMRSDGIFAALMPRKLESTPELSVDQDCALALVGSATARKRKTNKIERVVRPRMARL
jgi:hypothetical protein